MIWRIGGIFSSYKENEQWIDDGCSDFDDEMKSFFRCLCACELVGLDCKEKYMPHRVVMQFGMDQDLPGKFSCVEFERENLCFYVLSRCFVEVLELVEEKQNGSRRCNHWG